MKLAWNKNDVGLTYSSFEDSFSPRDTLMKTLINSASKTYMSNNFVSANINNHYGYFEIN